MNLPADAPRLMNRTRSAVAVAVAAAALAFALHTGQVWEDYYITYRPSKNLVSGLGLVFQPGERVHTFTSPINVLAPALFAFLTGNRSDVLVLWLYRVLCAAALGGGAALLLRAGERLGLSVATRSLMVVLLCLEVKIVAFTINGQEAGFMVLFIAAVIDALAERGPKAATRLGLAVAGLMWTRPDGFIYATALAAGVWVFPPASTLFRGRDGLRRLAKAALVALALYAPWLLWSWSYYGSPVPHTITAKRIVGHADTLLYFLQSLADYPVRILQGMTPASRVFTPIYVDNGGWPGAVYDPFGRITGTLCACYWALPFGRPAARSVSFAFVLCNFYLSYVIPGLQPWYLPSTSLIGIVVLAAIAQDGLELAAYLRRLGAARAAARVRRVVALGAALMAASLLALFLASLRQIRLEQQIVEEGGRKAIGLWLKAHARTPVDTVFLEPLGYIGFFSGLKMYDFPGLSSPEVVAARRRLGTDNWARLIRELRPDWLVLRATEAGRVQHDDAALFRDQYAVAMLFDATQAIERAGWIPGRPYLEADARYYVFRRLTDKP